MRSEFRLAPRISSTSSRSSLRRHRAAEQRIAVVVAGAAELGRRAVDQELGAAHVGLAEADALRELLDERVGVADRDDELVAARVLAVPRLRMGDRQREVARRARLHGSRWSFALAPVSATEWPSGSVSARRPRRRTAPCPRSRRRCARRACRSRLGRGAAGEVELRRHLQRRDVDRRHGEERHVAPDAEQREVGVLAHAVEACRWCRCARAGGRRGGCRRSSRGR